MTYEIPVLRLGLAGFSAEQQTGIGVRLARLGPPHVAWELGPLAEADGWWVSGERVQPLPDGTLRVSPGVPAARALQLSLPEVDRPLAFALPLASARIEPTCTFELKRDDTLARALATFTAWLQPVAAQFCLAAAVLKHEAALGTGSFQVIAGGRVIALVDLQGAIGVLPEAGGAQFEDALWKRMPGHVEQVPEGFLRTDLSQIMWQYAMRTRREVLPARYRSHPIFFRRPPRLPQRALRDAHLLLLRELATAPATFEELQLRTGLGAAALARELQALYLVGSITANPKRAGAGAMRRNDASDAPLSRPSSVLPSSFDTTPDPISAKPNGRPPAPDMTAPAPLWPR
jgi:hypothetical protein